MTGSPELTILPATAADYPVVQQLSAYYIYDFTEYLGWPCPESGRFGGCDAMFAEWQAGTNYPFIIRIDGELAGFAAVGVDAATREYSIQEFFILRKFRRRGIGKTVAYHLLNRFPGPWVVEYLAANTPAARFWPRAIRQYLGTEPSHCAEHDSPWGQMETLRFTGRTARLAGLDDIIASCMDDGRIPGLAIGIVAGGEVVCARGYGIRDTAHPQPLTEHCRFGIQSCTKAFTAALAGVLVERGLLAWDRPLRDYLPDFRMHDPRAGEQATMRDLLCHRTGMPAGGHDWLRVANRIPRQDYLERLPYLAPSQPFRQSFQYSNLMYIIAGAVMERLTGLCWEAMVRQWLFTPLGMTHSDCGEGENRIDDAGPCGAITSTVADMCRWLSAHLGTTSAPWLTAPTLRELQTPCLSSPNPLPAPEVEESGYALGWFTQRYRGHRLLAHWGGATGPTLVSFMPDDGIGIVVHSTRDASPFHAINAVALSAYDRLLGLEPLPWHARWRAVMDQPYLPPASAVEAMAPATDRALLGTYHHPGYGTITITDMDGACLLNYGMLTFRLARTETLALALALTGEVMHVLIDWWGVRHATVQTGADGTITAIAIPFEPAVPAVEFTRMY